MCQGQQNDKMTYFLFLTHAKDRMLTLVHEIFSTCRAQPMVVAPVVITSSIIRQCFPAILWACSVSLNVCYMFSGRSNLSSKVCDKLSLFFFTMSLCMGICNTL